MVRPFALAALPLCLVMLGAAASPAPDVIQKAFGNTIISTYPDGRQAELWLDPSGSYTALGRRHDPTSGQWQVNGGKLCLKQTHPFAPPFLNRYCTPIPSSESWTAKAVTGETVQVRLVHGHQLSPS